MSHHNSHRDGHHHGLAQDLQTLNRHALERRRALRWLAAGGAAALPLIGCGGGGSSEAAADSTAAASSTATSTGSASTSVSTTTATASSASCATIPSETAGPYPGDGTNSNSNGSGTVNALALSGIVRSNITSSFAGASGVAAGIPLSIKLNVVNSAAGCGSLAGFAVYLWHCDAVGRYSMYSAGVTGENYLRGVQVTGSDGSVTFTSVFPGCYDGRWPHIHFEVYSSAAAATRGSNAIKTTQLALPEDACRAVYADSRYPGSTANLNGTSLARDGIFSDGWTLEMASVTGSNTAGYAATLQVGVAA